MVLRETVSVGESIAIAVAALGSGVAVGMSISDEPTPHLITPLELPLLVVAAATVFLLIRSAPAGRAHGLPRWKSSGNARDDFLAVCKELTAELVAEVETCQPPLPSSVASHIARLVEYNVPKGKLNRGLTVVEAMEAIKGHAAPEQQWRAAALGWCIEWLQAYFLVADDIMDASETRRGQVCWYKVEDIGMNAINDGILLEMHIYSILRRHFREDPLYVPLMELFHEVTLQTAVGQLLDLTTADPDKVDFSRFCMATYTNIVVYKTAFYTFYLPIACAMLLSGYRDPALFAKAREICVLMGEYFQVQDDYLDCYGDPAKIGKVGTDIRDNKCSWLINTCLAVATPAQKKDLEANYARNDARCEAKVRQIFSECGVKEAFHEYEEATAAQLRALIAEVQGMPPTIFSTLLSRIYKRQK